MAKRQKLTHKQKRQVNSTLKRRKANLEVDSRELAGLGQPESGRVVGRFGQHADIEDTHGFINHLLVLDNVKVTCMFRDDGAQVKVSLRSTGDIDVGAIAVQLGGGGHSHSAATLLAKPPGKTLDDVINLAIMNIEKLL